MRLSEPPASRVPPAPKEDLPAGPTIVERIPLGRPCVFELGESKDPKGLPDLRFRWKDGELVDDERG